MNCPGVNSAATALQRGQHAFDPFGPGDFRRGHILNQEPSCQFFMV